MKRVIIIGGGASGLTAAIMAARKSQKAQIILLEQKDSPGKKILATGNRTCNLKYIEHNTYKSDVFSFGLCALFASTLCFESLYDVRELTLTSQVRMVIDKYLKKRYSNRIIDLKA